MAKRLMQALGVDIGTQSIKVAVVRRGKDGAVVSAVGKGPTPEGTVDHTGIFDPQAIGGALKALLVESGIQVKDVIFSISGQSSVVVRNLEVPRMSDKELESHMQWEIQRNIPFAESTVVSDYRPVPNPDLDGTQNMEVVMAVSPQSAIDMILELIKASGCRAAAIDVEPLALGRIVQSCHYSDLADRRVCVVHIGHTTTAIDMYRNGLLAFPRSIPIGGAMLTQALASALGLTTEEAESQKMTAVIPDAAASAAEPFAVPGATMQADYSPYNPFAEGGAAPEGEAPAEGAPAAEAPVPAAAPADSHLFDAMRPQVEEFVAELRRSIDYYRSRGGDIDTIALSGGGANLKGFDLYINRSLGLPVTRLNPFQGIGVELPVDSDGMIRDGASEFAIAVGMGLHIAYD